MPRKRNQPIPDGFPRLVADELERRGMPQKDLASLVGVDQSTISNLLSGSRGRTPRRDSIATQIAVARALGLPTDSVVLPAEESDSPTWRRAVDTYQWPPGTPTAVVASISEALSKEAFSHRNAHIPVTHWTNRIGEELATAKGKRVEPARTEDGGDGPSPEMRAHKASAKKRRAS